MQEQSIRILGIAGSTRPGSLNKMTLAAAAEQLPPGCTLDIFDLMELMRRLVGMARALKHGGGQ